MPDPTMGQSGEFRQWVRHVWERLELTTGRTIFYLDSKHLGSYCPRCVDGFVQTTLLNRPGPGVAFGSVEHPRGCSLGCTEGEIAEVLFG